MRGYTMQANAARTCTVRAKKNENDQLRKDVNNARKDFAETLQAELNSQAESDNEAEQGATKINTARLLMEFLKDKKMPEFKTGSRTDKNEPAVYVDELKNLTNKNHDKYHDQLH